MLRAHSRGMTNGEYVFIAPTLLPHENHTELWKRGDDQDDLAMEAYRSLLQVCTGKELP